MSRRKKPATCTRAPWQGPEESEDEEEVEEFLATATEDEQPTVSMTLRVPADELNATIAAIEQSVDEVVVHRVRCSGARLLDDPPGRGPMRSGQAGGILQDAQPGRPDSFDRGQIRPIAKTAPRS